MTENFNCHTLDEEPLIFDDTVPLHQRVTQTLLWGDPHSIAEYFNALSETQAQPWTLAVVENQACLSAFLRYRRSEEFIEFLTSFLQRNTQDRLEDIINAALLHDNAMELATALYRQKAVPIIPILTARLAHLWGGLNILNLTEEPLQILGAADAIDAPLLLDELMSADPDHFDHVLEAGCTICDPLAGLKVAAILARVGAERGILDEVLPLIETCTEIYVSDDSFSALMTNSAHATLALIDQEPDLISLLERPANACFYGYKVTPASRTDPWWRLLPVTDAGTD